MNLRSVCAILVVLVALIITFWNSTEIFAPEYHVNFTVDRRENAAGTLSIHPYVEETDEIPCEYVDKPQKPHKSDNTWILMCKSHTLFCSFWYTLFIFQQ